MQTKLPNLRIFLVLTIITGLLYPAFITLIGCFIFPDKAHGSLIKDRHGRVWGSELIAQPVHSPSYFSPRPSACDYATMPSGASNLPWSSKKLQQIAEARREALCQTHKLPQNTQVPSDLIFTSASGIEPFISREAAFFQAPRVANARGIPLQHIHQIIERHISSSIVGPSVVNTMTLNYELDHMHR